MDEFARKGMDVGRIFTPRTPINARKLFSGRTPQINKVLDSISQMGSHAVLYGERGVGKTSLANVLSDFATGPNIFLPRINCDGSDTFSTLWKKALQDLQFTRRKQGIGFTAGEVCEVDRLVDQLPEELSPDQIRRIVADAGRGSILVFIFDEYDRLTDRRSRTMMADTLKMFSDYAVPATILLIGVADTVDELVEDHLSIERALVQIPMPRMSLDEIREIVENGFTQLGMSIGAQPLETIVDLSQGLPYVTHLLALHTTKVALDQKSLSVDDTHVNLGTRRSLEEWQQSIKSGYYAATRSQQPDTIYKHVLLACALADKDDFGYFSAADVRTPLRLITGKNYDIPNFARHLKEFTLADRGSVIQKSGSQRKIRYRFSSPLLQPYIIIRASSEGELPPKQ